MDNWRENFRSWDGESKADRLNGIRKMILILVLGMTKSGFDGRNWRKFKEFPYEVDRLMLQLRFDKIISSAISANSVNMS